jgi:hypothetical protein
MYGLKYLSREENLLVKKLRRIKLTTLRLIGAKHMLNQRGLDCVQGLSAEAMKGVVTGGMEVDRGKVAAATGNVACRAGEVKLKTAQYNDEKKRAAAITAKFKKRCKSCKS